MTAVDVEPFRITGPLPRGVTVLEASAGTGKTYTIAGLTTRYVADGMKLEELLLVTFARMAAGELRERVRERLVAAEAALTSGVLPDGDEVVALLASERVEERRGNLRRALAGFDAATIETTHGFCHAVLAGLGILGDIAAGAELMEDDRDLIAEVVDDLYVRRFHGRDTPDFDRAEALAIAQAAIHNPIAPLVPADAPEDSVAAMRVRLAHAARAEFERRKTRAGVITYDDQLTRLLATLRSDEGEAAAAKLRARYRVVMIDEFQDTDEVQWEIVRRAFGSHCTLVLIGDPKQAIYAFRGADVYSYLRAAETATRQTLTTNWRSDQPLIDAYDALFDGASLGHPGIVYREVKAAETHARLHDAPDPRPLRARVVPRGLTGSGRHANVDRARELIAGDLAADVVALLESPARIHERVKPGDIAVLVRTHRNARIVREALDRARVPAVINGANNVFETPQARDWLRLLEALGRPSSSSRARSAALTAFIGWSAQRVATETDAEDLHQRLHAWARVLRDRGVAALLETITLTEGLPQRMLVREDGEREITDLRHIGQLLHEAAMAEQLGTTALATWLRERIRSARDEQDNEERSRRLESDADAVQIQTIHRCKGLQFPIVYLPDLWDPGWIPDDKLPVAFHDAAADDVRTVDVGLDGPDFPAHRRQYVIERRGEDLRLAYVALTRAMHQAVVWWVGTHGARHGPLTRLLFSRGADGSIDAYGRATPEDEAVRERLDADWAEGYDGVVWSGRDEPVADLDVATFDRALDWRWRRTSYSDLTAGTYEPRVASEPEEDVVADEPAEPSPAPVAPGQGSDAAPILLDEMPVGLKVGTFVHRLYEAADFAAPDLDAELASATAALQARRPVALGAQARALAGLRATLETPLGTLAGDVRLRDITRADRLSELEFELPLAGGDDPSGQLEISAVSDLLREHLPAGDPLRDYADRLADPRIRAAVRGYLTGSIDLVMRLPADRFAIADYKTNWLSPPDVTATTWHYRPAALVAEMQHHHYLLQALLYTVALHRYLRWRVAGYDPDAQLAGVLYLFVRGMVGEATPRLDGTPCGVFAWRPPTALVVALSELLA